MIGGSLGQGDQRGMRWDAGAGVPGSLDEMSRKWILSLNWGDDMVGGERWGSCCGADADPVSGDARRKRRQEGSPAAGDSSLPRVGKHPARVACKVHVGMDDHGCVALTGRRIGE